MFLCLRPTYILWSAALCFLPVRACVCPDTLRQYVPKYYAQYTPPTRLSCRVELRRQCVHNSQLVGDSLDESEQICQQLSRVASCRRCERTRRQSWPSLQFPVLYCCWASNGNRWRHNDVIDEKVINIDQNSRSQTAIVASRRRRLCVLGFRRIFSKRATLIGAFGTEASASDVEVERSKLKVTAGYNMLESALCGRGLQ